MEDSSSDRIRGRNRTRSLWLLAIGALLVTAGLLVGIDDNLPGIALVAAGLCVLVLAAVHRWRSVKRFLVLAGLSVLGFGLFAVVHNVVHELVEMTEGIVVLHQVMQFVNGASFLIALLVCPAALLVGLIGAAWITAHNLSRPRAHM